MRHRLRSKQPHLFPGFHSCSVQLPRDPGNRWGYVKVMQRAANFVFPFTSKHFIGLIRCKISSYTWGILTRRHGWITSVITNLSGLMTWPGGRGGEGIVPCKQQHTCSAPFAWATDTHTCQSHKWSFAHECKCLPLAQVELYAHSFITHAAWGLGTPELGIISLFLSVSVQVCTLHF